MLRDHEGTVGGVLRRRFRLALVLRLDLLIDNSLKTPGYTKSWAKWANVGIVEDLSDIDTIVGAQAR